MAETTKTLPPIRPESRPRRQPKRRVSLLVPQPIHRQLRREARLREVTVSAVLREAIAQALDLDEHVEVR